MLKKILEIKNILFFTGISISIINFIVASQISDVTSQIILTVSGFFLFFIGIGSYIFTTARYMSYSNKNSKTNYSLNNELTDNIDTGLILYDKFNRIIEVSNYLREKGLVNLEGSQLSEVFKDIKSMTDTSEVKSGSVYMISGRSYIIKNLKYKRALILKDITKEKSLEKKVKDLSPVLIFLKLNNINSSNVDQVERAKILYAAEGIIDKWSKENNAFYTHTYSSETDYQWNISLNYHDLRKSFLKFDNLKKVYSEDNNLLSILLEMSNKTNLSPLISVGIGYGANNFNDNSKLAQEALIEADENGSNQTIVKEYSAVSYMLLNGEKENLIVNNKETSVFASRLFKNIEESKEVIAISHNYLDADAIASLSSIYEICNFYNKKIKIYIESMDSSATKIFNNLFDKKAKKSIVRDLNTLEKNINSDKLLILLDSTAKKQLPKIRKLEYYNSSNMIIIDHHVEGNDSITADSNNTFIDTTASSTSEILSNVLYILENRNRSYSVPSYLAKMLLVGIYIDSIGITSNVTYHTFEAIAFLTKKNVKLSEATKYSNISLETFIDSNIVLKTIQSIDNRLLIASSDDEFITKDNTSLAISVDRLIKVENVQAAFIVARIDKNTIKISARDTGEYNSSEVCSYLGGGGRETAAAAFVKNKTVEQVREMLIEAIKKVGN